MYFGEKKVEVYGFVTTFKGRTVAIIADDETGELTEVALNRLNDKMPISKVAGVKEKLAKKAEQDQKKAEEQFAKNGGEPEMSEESSEEKKGIFDKAKDAVNKMTHSGEKSEK